MAVIEQLNKFGSLNESELSFIEDTIGVHFPTDYKEFLSKSNGGFPKNGYWVVNAPSLTDELLISSFLGMNEDENFNIVGWNQEYQEELPTSTFIFGIEYGGGMFIQITKGKDKGVYFWDSNFNLPGTSDDENVFFLADSFTEFLNIISIEG